MGGGSYSSVDRGLRASFAGYHTKSAQEIFTERNINSAMNPFGLSMREARDSVEHPNSMAIVIALDVTGSMGSVPHFLVKEGLPNMMDNIIKGGVPDPQVLFLGIGDHTCDKAPLQVGQFESSDELLDKWLTTVYLEGGGGGNDGESYLLAWYLAAQHTSIDCFEKRGQKGVLVTIGDEPVLPGISQRTLKQIMGEGQFEDYTAQELLEKVSGKYHVYHINIKETSSGSRGSVMNGWKQLLADNLEIAERKADVASIVATLVLKHKIFAGMPTQPVVFGAKPEEVMML